MGQLSHPPRLATRTTTTRPDIDDGFSDPSARRHHHHHHPRSVGRSVRSFVCSSSSLVVVVEAVVVQSPSPPSPRRSSRKGGGAFTFTFTPASAFIGRGCGWRLRVSRSRRIKDEDVYQGPSRAPWGSRRRPRSRSRSRSRSHSLPCWVRRDRGAHPGRSRCPSASPKDQCARAPVKCGYLPHRAPCIVHRASCIVVRVHDPAPEICIPIRMLAHCSASANTRAVQCAPCQLGTSYVRAWTTPSSTSRYPRPGACSLPSGPPARSHTLCWEGGGAILGGGCVHTPRALRLCIIVGIITSSVIPCVASGCQSGRTRARCAELSPLSRGCRVERSHSPSAHCSPAPLGSRLKCSVPTSP
ncbi:hypothetical protein C8Q79DRAFT_251985 [Trametes meyenii]|nr:hypothetical protein C8Q79DRAFT_251985 [Trametes meyenii]